MHLGKTKRWSNFYFSQVFFSREPTKMDESIVMVKLRQMCVSCQTMERKNMPVLETSL